MGKLLAEDKVVRYVTQESARYPEILKVKLFGSRARGDARERSDYDLVFYLAEWPEPRWARFCLDLQENAPTLCGLDLIKWDQSLREEFKHHIEKEGKVIYERQSD